MKDLDELNEYRRPHPLSREKGDSSHGCFVVPYKKTKKVAILRIVASGSEGWDHVSISLENRCPTWEEMDFVKRLFFKPDEVAIQYHVPVEDHISLHPYCLHLWRPHRVAIQMPPKWMIA